MTINAKFREWVTSGETCNRAPQWVKGRSLVQAWRDCQNGSWMAWWLYDRLGVSIGELKDLAPYAVVREGIFCDWQHTSEDVAQLADTLRRHYTPSGKRRTGTEVYLAK